MKSSKFSPLKMLSCIIILALLLPACAQTGGDTPSHSSAEKPDIDLQTAVISGNLEAVKQHIEAGSNLNEKEPFGGSTPLITAATFDKTEIAKALIDAGADLSLKNKDGSTALHAAAIFCRVEIVQMLLDAKADKTIRNNYGATARETVMGPFSDMKPVYELMAKQLSPLGLQLDLAELEKTRPVVSMMLE